MYSSGWVITQIASFNPHTHPMRMIPLLLLPILQKTGAQRDKEPAQGYTVSKWQSPNLNTGSLNH